MRKLLLALTIFLTPIFPLAYALDAPSCGSSKQLAEALYAYQAYLDYTFPDGSMRYVSNTLHAWIVVKTNDAGQWCIISHGHVDKDGKFVALP